jgi:hypothetical protein
MGLRETIDKTELYYIVSDVNKQTDEVVNRLYEREQKERKKQNFQWGGLTLFLMAVLIAIFCVHTNAGDGAETCKNDTTYKLSTRQCIDFQIKTDTSGFIKFIDSCTIKSFDKGLLKKEFRNSISYKK